MRHQRKYRSAGTGLAKVTSVSGADQDFLDLTRIKKLSPAELASVNAQAPALDRRGYTVSKDVYTKTPHAVVSTPSGGAS